MNTQNQEAPARRTQESRSAATRERLLQAAIESLHQDGYAATSTSVVAAKAGVSRGAMLHQFPTKVDLMLFVVQAVYEQELELYAEALGAIADPHERIRAFPMIVWDVLCRPAGVAVLEIMQGARSDTVMSERLRPLQTEIEEHSFRRAAAMLGRGDTQPAPEKTRLVVWAVRGLSIARLLSDHPDDARKSVEVLRDLLIPPIPPTT